MANIVFNSPDGLQVCGLDAFIRQPTPSMLYDLNRDEVTVLTFTDDPKWVNDYACAKVIEALKIKADKYDRMEAKIAEIYENEEDERDLVDIGEIAARELGFL